MKDQRSTKIIFRTSMKIKDGLRARAERNGRTMTGELNHIVRSATKQGRV